MPCLFALLALSIPRVLTAYLWFFTHWFEGVFHGLLWPLLGFFFAPTTLLWYTTVHNVWQGHWGFWQIVVLIGAVMIDFSPSTSKRKKK